MQAENDRKIGDRKMILVEVVWPHILAARIPVIVRDIREIRGSCSAFFRRLVLEHQSRGVEAAIDVEHVAVDPI